MQKLISTFRILFALGMARTFGTYVHDCWNGEFDYAVYDWRGKRFAFPKSAMEDINAD